MVKRNDNVMHNIPCHQQHIQHRALSNSFDLSKACAAGVQILAQQGNAVDAAITTALCQGILSPAASGLGGGHFMVIRSPDGSSEVIDAREPAPAAASQNMFSGQLSSFILLYTLTPLCLCMQLAPLCLHQLSAFMLVYALAPLCLYMHQLSAFMLVSASAQLVQACVRDCHRICKSPGCGNGWRFASCCCL